MNVLNIPRHKLMFDSLAVNYRMLAANNRCIYSQYKIYAEKYYCLKKMIKDLRYQNKTMEKELKELKKELLQDVINYNNDDVIIQINGNYIQDHYIVKIDNISDNEEIEEIEDKYELV